MSDTVLTPLPVTQERFAAFGDVIDTRSDRRAAMNDARFERFDDLAAINIDESDGAHVAISIARSRVATAMPYRFDMVERHPHGSQAFIPRSEFPFIVVVAAAGEAVGTGDMQAFMTNGHQGINYHRGTWHMPLISLQAGQEFLIVDRAGGGSNCEERVLSDAIVLKLP